MSSAPLEARYTPIGDYYRRRFGCRVYKVSVSTAQSCPNREGLGGASVCIFCDQWGSAAYHDLAGRPFREQFRVNRERIRTRYRAEKFLVYFQAYTNTFDRISRMEALFAEALAEEDVVGVVLGTRPDCLPGRVMRFLAEQAGDHFVSVELGVQTLDDGQLRFLSRGHDRACSLAALEKLRAVPEIDVCAHLIFGIPGENDDQLRETARLLSQAGVHGVKLHNLHVLRGTPLEERYRSGEFSPVGLEEYARKVSVFLEHLSPEIAVHRLAAVASRWDEVVAPEWVKGKMGPTQFIRDYLVRKNTWQGKYQLPPARSPRFPPAVGAAT